MAGEYKYYIGVDPGKTGGIVIIDSTSLVIEVFKTPETIRDFIDRLTPYMNESVFCLTEKVSSMPQNGGKANYTFGYINGVLHTVLTTTGIPFELVTPRTWMKSYMMKKGKSEGNTQWKNRLKQKAQMLFPKEKVTLWNADALLIAEYCKRMYK